MDDRGAKGEKGGAGVASADVQTSTPFKPKKHSIFNIVVMMFICFILQIMMLIVSSFRMFPLFRIE